ncbi:MAG TPA: VWA domain-containing protein [Terriglobales bacterium]|nr:VWA domain-containing protein [Terriglobales bacterium]
MADLPQFGLRWRTALRLIPLALLVPACSLYARPFPQQGDTKPSSPPAAAAHPSQTAEKNAPELSTRDTANTFKVRVNLVLVRVVVRDDHGNIVKDLHKEDFRLFDNRKEQTISSFSVETPTSHVVPIATSPSDTETVTPETTAATLALPQRFVALLFDDIHLEMGDAVNVRAAASRIFDSLRPSDRVGIFTTSGQFAQDFTSDKDLLKTALLRIIPRPVAGTGFHDCPDVTYYMGDLIINQNQPQALAVATEDAVQCAFNGDHSQTAAARMLATSAAQRALNTGDAQSTLSYQTFHDVIRRISLMPGQRTVVFISPGFILSSLYTEESDLIDRAVRSNLVIDTLDARGLYAPDVAGDIADPPVSSSITTGIEASYRIQSQSANEDVLRDISYGTGGTYYHNRNDLDAALKDAVAAPPVTYLLAFSPQNLKLNGAFHSLSIKLTSKNKFSIQARRGYYAPRTLKDPAEQAKEEIQEAVFSQDEIHDFPIEIQTQFFLKDETDARLSVLAHVDMKNIPFAKADGRNDNNLTLATAIFDENGNFVAGNEKVLEMRFFDSTLNRVQQSGITVKSSFDIKPGNYLVRLVVRDAQGQEMAARNGAVVIPY